MSKDSRLASKIKAQMTRFVGRLAEGDGRPERRFVGEMLYGLQAARDVKLSEIGRSLNEPIRLIKTENRLSRNLAARDRTERLNRRIAWEGAGLVGSDTVLAIDRGGDRVKLLEFALERGLSFVIRQRGDRHVLTRKGERQPVRAVGWRSRFSERRTIEVERDGERIKKTLKVGVRKVRLPSRPKDWLWIVTIRGFGENPIFLLTNVPPPKTGSHGWWIGDIYLTRWKCEEAYRFLKQPYGLEDVRVRKYAALRSLYALLHAVFYFVSAVLGAKVKLNLLLKKVCEKSKRFYEVATFFQYALADGLHRLLFALRHGPPRPPDNSGPQQRLLAFAKPPD